MLRRFWVPAWFSFLIAFLATTAALGTHGHAALANDLVIGLVALFGFAICAGLWYAAITSKD
jgi:hypothetical protein